MRVKTIAKRARSALNGVTKSRSSTDPPASETKTPQPQDLSETDKAALRAYLDKNEKPFTVTTTPLTKKRKRTSLAMQVQNDLFDDRLAVQYEVKPNNSWENLRKYKKFTVGSESIATGECILVKHDDSEEARLDIPGQWKAKVLEVRALDQEHVYIRVAWLNRPEDLDSGRKPYHGKNELIPTNQMDVIDAMTVNGRLDVHKWDEYEDDKNLPFEDQYYWRQTYDYANTNSFSELRAICKDKAPQNPDQLILQCPNVDCRQWLHARCIAEAAVIKASEEEPKPNGAGMTKKKAKAEWLTISPGSSAQAKAQKLPFTAEVFIKGLPNALPHEAAESTEIVVTRGDGTTKTIPVTCLFCDDKID